MDFKPAIDLSSAAILFGVFQALLLAFLFLKNGMSSPWAPAGAMIVALSLIELESFLNYSGFVISWPHFVNISPPLILTLGPLAYLHCRRISGRPMPLSAAAHFIPALCYLAYSFFFYLQPVAFKIYAVMKDTHPGVAPFAQKIFATDPLHIQGWIVIEGISLHLFGYVLISLILAFRKNDTGDPKDISWIRFMSVNLLTGSLLFMLTGGKVNGYELFHPILPPVVVNLYCTLLVYSISVFWIARFIPSALHLKKYAKSEIPNEIRIQKLQRIKEILEVEKPYKQSGFGLDSLSKRMSISSHHLSQIINTGLGMSFLELINLYRINEAREILKTPGLRDTKVETLAYDLGYQSKSAFFNAFKRQTQTTPARYRDGQTMNA